MPKCIYEFEVTTKWLKVNGQAQTDDWFFTAAEVPVSAPAFANTMLGAGRTILIVELHDAHEL